MQSRPTVPPLNLLALLLEHEIASFRLHDFGAMQVREQLGPAVQVNPTAGSLKE